MCGRFTQHFTWTEVHAFLDVFGPARNLQPRYNIAPTTTIDVVRLGRDGRRELLPMRWGLVPYFWKKPLKDLPATFNARAESVHEKPMFREAFRRGRRCIIPASGFYEWTQEPDGKQPHLFSAVDGRILAFAGVWDRWVDPTGAEILSATIIVSGASAWMEPFHDRMPVLLDEADFDAWLTGAAGVELLHPAREDALRAWVVSRRVNSSRTPDDDPTLVDPVAA